MFLLNIIFLQLVYKEQLDCNYLGFFNKKDVFSVFLCINQSSLNIKCGSKVSTVDVLHIKSKQIRVCSYKIRQNCMESHQIHNCAIENLVSVLNLETSLHKPCGFRKQLNFSSKPDFSFKFLSSFRHTWKPVEIQ